MAKQVSKTYGSALFEVAMENRSLDATLEEVLFVKQTFLENEELSKFLLHPNIEKEEKVKVIENIYAGRVSDELTGTGNTFFAPFYISHRCQDISPLSSIFSQQM